MLSTGKRICPICEAGCGLNITTDGRTVVEIRGNKDDVFSTGHVCPKGISLAELDADPDRLTRPLILKNGKHVATSWEEAFELICTRLNQIKESTGPNSIAVYIGNPTAHNVGLSMGLGIFCASLGSSNIFSAGSVDQLPKQLACELMFGDGMAVPVPDIERCDFMLMLGANPIVSNGSLWMVPKFREKLRAFHERGGKLVTIDPRLSETAKLADQHHFIRPGTDAWLLGAIINELRMQGLDIPDRYRVKNQQTLFQHLQSITTERAANLTGIQDHQIRSIATQLSTAKHSVVYGRVGTTLQVHGTLTSFLVEIINIMTGSLDSAGGAMFPEQPFALPSRKKETPDYNRYQSRVSGYPEVLGQMPTACLAEEIETAGEGKIRALVTFAGNPVISNQDSNRLANALSSLDFMICVDIYHNETTRLADVILPGTSPFEDSHYDHFLGAMGYRNSARYSPPLFENTSRPDEWSMSLTLAFIVDQGTVPSAADLDEYENNIVASYIANYTQDPDGPLFNRDVQEILGSIGPERGVERLLDLGIRAGRWGDHFGKADGFNLQRLIETPDGIDLGPPRPRLNEIVISKDQLIDLAPTAIIEDLDRLDTSGVSDELLLIGRRNIQTNNSWLHNLPLLSKGSNKSICYLELNPLDAEKHKVESDDWVEIRSATGAIRVPVKVSKLISQGVVSLPHGFSGHRGANYNILAAAARVDGPSATAALNGIPVTISRIKK